MILPLFDHVIHVFFPRPFDFFLKKEDYTKYFLIVHDNIL